MRHRQEEAGTPHRQDLAWQDEQLRADSRADSSTLHFSMSLPLLAGKRAEIT